MKTYKTSYFLITQDRNIKSKILGSLILLILILFCSSVKVTAQCPPGNVTILNQADLNTYLALYPTCTQIDGNLVIGPSNDIADLDELSALTDIFGYTEINQNDVLENINGLMTLESVTGSMTITNNSMLSIIDLGALNSLGGNFRVADNTNLLTLSGPISIINYPASLEIRGNQMLSSINGFQGVESVGSLFQIIDTKVTVLPDLSSLTTVGNALNIENNDNIEEVNLTDLAFVGGTFKIVDNLSLTTLFGPSLITDYPSKFEIRGNPILATITGFDAISSVGNVLNIYDTQVSDLPDFSSLITVGAGINILNNQNINELNFSNLTSIGGAFTIIDNSSLSELNAPTDITYYPGPVDIKGNSNLSIFTGFNDVTTFNSRFALHDIIAVSFPDMLNLTTIGNILNIIDNSNIVDLNWIQNLSFVGAGITIQNNNFLTDCAINIVCERVLTNGNITVSGNTGGCIDEPAVENSCVPSEISLNTSLCNQIVPIGSALIAEDLNTVYDQYRFRFYDEAVLVETIDVPLNTAPSILEASSFLAPNVEYGVTIAVMINGSFGSEGPVCSVTLENNLKLASSQCDNDNVSILSSPITQTGNNVYDQYRFTFFESETDAISNTNAIGEIIANTGEQPNFQSAAPFLDINQQYWCTVAVQFNGVFSNEGPVCYFTLINNRSLVPCGSENLSLLSSPITLSSNSVFDRYRFSFYDKDPSLNVDAELVLSILVEQGETPSFLVAAPELILGNTYYSTVAVEVNGIFSNEGPVCSLVLTCPNNTAGLLDTDMDGIVDICDNCPDSPNPGQEDFDNNGIGDVCDPFCMGPDAPELCDGIDNNCNGIIDEGFDQDVDGFKTCDGDCDDSNPNIYPGNEELCDGVDNNCDGQIDEGFDNDEDGFTACDGDCDDTNPSVNPSVLEICDGIDNNCNGVIDEGFDQDGDGVTDCFDNCPNQANPDQSDSDCDNVGDVCDQWDGCDDTKDVNNNGIPDCIDLERLQDWNCQNKVNKVLVCHIPPGNPGNQHTICISENAVNTHLNNHGDYIGECQQINCEDIMNLDFRSNISKSSPNTDVFLYPNPATFSINLNFKSFIDQEIYFAIYNHVGNLILEVSNHRVIIPEYQLDLSDNKYVSGIYLLVINSKETQIAKKFVIAK